MSALRIFVVGRTGQVAQALAHAAEPELKCGFFGRPDIDLMKPDTVLRALDAFKPDIVLNAAAYTAVDKAEEESDVADTVNSHAPRRLAQWSDASGVPLIHMSTDCVFDGAKSTGYIETDTPAPINAYGRSKADGEAAVATVCTKHLIVRVCWVHSHFGNSFPRTMLTLAETRNEVTVVDDQVGRPTHALDLADSLLSMARKCSEPDFNDWGIYHLAGHGETDRASMAEAVFSDSKAADGPSAKVKRVSTQIFGAAAPRPLNARLDSVRTEQVFNLRLPHWRSRLTDCVQAILMEESRP